MNRKERRSAGKRSQAASPAPNPAQISNLFAEAVRHQKVGRLFDAEALCRQVLARDAGHAYRAAAELLAQLGLAAHIDAYPAEISAGEQRRAVIARALVNAPSLLLADEPTSDLDEETEREIMEQFRAVNRERAMTLIMVTHNLRLAEQTDRVVHIANGRLVA